LLAVVVLCASVTTKNVIMVVLLGILLGEWWSRRREKKEKSSLLRWSERSLPVVMERLVMAVGTGLDVIPALKEAAAGGVDPVSLDIGRMVMLAESGLSVEEAIKAISNESSSSSLKHAFMHIRLAYQQGGEVVRPLKELSDATQTAYQEGVEEQIAKLPVKAVMPLLLTFAGLIVCFLTVPLIQVGSIAKKVTHAAP
jgi:Flp pilus assembly protein TadB